MKDHGLLFKDEMCRAIGRAVDPKTQTRRIVARHNTLVAGDRVSKAQWEKLDFSRAKLYEGMLGVPWSGTGGGFNVLTPIYEFGDRIWAKQVFDELPAELGGGVFYREDMTAEQLAEQAEARRIMRTGRPWRSSLLMPKRLARYVLEVTEAVRAERACDISEVDAKAEGVRACDRCFGTGIDPVRIEGTDPEWCSLCGGGSQGLSYRDAFTALWADINGAETLDSWCWRIPFKRTAQARGVAA